MQNKFRLAIFLIMLSFFSSLPAQRLNQNYLNYIEQYSGLAMEQMRQHKIPASIKLAQGLLESAAGTSNLAKKSNNHFGIKCGGSAWTGPSVSHNDDEIGECFRKYKSVVESYNDHSAFLKRQRYANLFTLRIDDYKGWARGLKAAGYATNPVYAQSLINLIELYELHQYDEMVLKGKKQSGKSNHATPTHQVFYNNNNYYIIAKQGDTFKGISKETGVSTRRLIKYNELNKHYQLKEGDIIYMEKKRKRAHKAFKKQVHVVGNNESIYSISQKYGIRLDRLYKLNKLPASHSVSVGDTLRIY